MTIEFELDPGWLPWICVAVGYPLSVLLVCLMFRLCLWWEGERISQDGRNGLVLAAILSPLGFVMVAGFLLVHLAGPLLARVLAGILGPPFGWIGTLLATIATGKSTADETTPIDY